MAPNVTSQTLLLQAKTDVRQSKEANTSKSSQILSGTSTTEDGREHYEWKISWRNVLAFVYLHTTTLYASYLLFSGQIKLYTVLFALLIGVLASLGVTGGAHRLWAHKAYKAKWQLRVILALLQTMAFQNHIYEWVRDHRVHHKFTDTNADPHNSKRGFFFSHMGWLMVRKHEDVKTKGKTVDLSDLEQDPVVVWQRRTYLVLMPLLCFVMPTLVPIYAWDENIYIAWYATVFRYTVSLNLTWLVNSAAHIWGTKPYDKNISPTENKAVGVLALGEGWHNYHHVFPWDYKAAELGNYSVNLTTAFIDFFAKIGWAYNLRSVSIDVIRKKALKTGDGSLKDPQDPKHHMNSVWGWGDKDMTLEDINSVTVNYPDEKNL